MLTAVHLLLRGDDDDPPVFIRSYRSYEAALAACEQAHRYLEAPDAPPAPGGAPEGFAVSTVIPDDGQRPVVLYRSSPSATWETEVESRATYPMTWALYDARVTAFYWWQRANPIDPEGPLGAVYSVVVVEHEDA